MIERENGQQTLNNQPQQQNSEHALRFRLALCSCRRAETSAEIVTIDPVPDEDRSAL